MLSRLRGKLQTLGWSDTALFIVARVVHKVSFGSARLIKYYFVAQPVPQHAPKNARGHGSTRLYLATATDAVIAQAPRPEQVLMDRFSAQHARCIVAHRNEELAGFIWLCPASYCEDEVRCVYRWTPDRLAMWDFDVFIAPQFRMGRLFTRMWDSAHAELRPEGVEWTLSRIDAFNSASLAAHRKLGARNLGRAFFMVIGRVQLTLLSQPPFFHLSFGEGHVPLVCFDLSVLTAPT